jgi:hypothetical protein
MQGTKWVALAAVVASAFIVTAAPAEDMHAAKPVSLTGEVIDTGCYLAHEARGAKHVGCATKCIAGGMPMGLLTADGTLYLVTLNHDDADPYHKLMKMAGQTVTVTGVVSERSGMKGVDVTAVRAAAVPASKPAGK